MPPQDDQTQQTNNVPMPEPQDTPQSEPSFQMPAEPPTVEAAPSVTPDPEASAVPTPTPDATPMAPPAYGVGDDDSSMPQSSEPNIVPPADSTEPTTGSDGTDTSGQ